MIAFVQPWGLESPNGGARIFRSLLRSAPIPFLSVCTSPQPPPPTTIGPEWHIPLRPSLGRLERTRFERHLWHLSPMAVGRFLRGLQRVLQDNRVEVVHAVPHGLEFWHAFQLAQQLGLRYVLNVMDDVEYTLVGRPDWTEARRRLPEVWCKANGRVVISREMGNEYSKRYGERPFSIVTDGLTELPAGPHPRPTGRMRVYIAGLIHSSYRANLSALLTALADFRAAHPKVEVTFTCRGGGVNPKQARIPVRPLPWATDRDVACDLAAADLLYLPLPFDAKCEPFYRFSLSTKMVTYLGSGLPILYHGPDEAAAGRLLRENQAAILVNTLDAHALMLAFARVQRERAEVVDKALQLARNKFMLSDQVDRFWRLACDEQALAAS